MTPNTKIWLQAVRAPSYPPELVDDETEFAVFTDRIYAVNPKFPPRVYDVASGEWSQIDFSQPPDKLMPRYKEFIKGVESQS